MDASAFSSLSAVARSCLAMWGAQFFIFEGAPFRLSLKSMPLAKIICKRHFHMSGEMVPPQYSPSDTTSARSPLAVPQGEVPEERGRSGTSLSSRAGSAVPRDIFCSAPPLGCGIHSRLGRQTANNGTSWRLICAPRGAVTDRRPVGPRLSRLFAANLHHSSPFDKARLRAFAFQRTSAYH